MEVRYYRTSFVIHNLKPGTIYNVSVTAFTSAGEGPSAKVEKETDKSGEYIIRT
jgi:hypothetical protein